MWLIFSLTYRQQHTLLRGRARLTLSAARGGGLLPGFVRSINGSEGGSAGNDTGVSCKAGVLRFRLRFLPPPFGEGFDGEDASARKLLAPCGTRERPIGLVNGDVGIAITANRTKASEIQRGQRMVDFLREFWPLSDPNFQCPRVSPPSNAQYHLPWCSRLNLDLRSQRGLRINEQTAWKDAISFPSSCPCRARMSSQSAPRSPPRYHWPQPHVRTSYDSPPSSPPAPPSGLPSAPPTSTNPYITSPSSSLSLASQLTAATALISSLRSSLSASNHRYSSLSSALARAEDESRALTISLEAERREVKVLRSTVERMRASAKEARRGRGGGGDTRKMGKGRRKDEKEAARRTLRSRSGDNEDADEVSGGRPPATPPPPPRPPSLRRAWDTHNPLPPHAEKTSSRSTQTMARAEALRDWGQVRRQPGGSGFEVGEAKVRLRMSWPRGSSGTGGGAGGGGGDGKDEDDMDVMKSWELENVEGSLDFKDM